MDQFKFTIIIPIYNSERWLKATIQSVVEQSIRDE